MKATSKQLKTTYDVQLTSDELELISSALGYLQSANKSLLAGKVTEAQKVTLEKSNKFAGELKSDIYMEMKKYADE